MFFLCQYSFYLILVKIRVKYKNTTYH